MKKVDLRVDNGTVITLDGQRRIIKDASVVIDEGKIIAIDKTDKIDILYDAGKKIDAQGNMVLPGLVDVHLHNVQQLSRGLADDVGLVTWIYDRILPYEACMSEDDVYWSSMLTVIENIRTGTTCACDPGGYHMDGVGRAYEETGLRGIISWAGMDQWSGDRDIPDSLPGKKSTEATLAEMERVVKTWNGVADGRIRASYALRTEPNVSEKLFKETKRLADRDGALIHMHTAVNCRQVEWMLKNVGYRSIEYLDAIGVLGPNWLLVHMACLTEHEIELLAKHDVKIAHVPGACLHGTYGAVSDGKIPEMLEAGITVAIGCDANSANNSLDMFRAMYLAATVHKEARLDPSLVSPEKALEMATIDSAKAIGWADEIGSLEVGKEGDLIIVDINQTNWVPTFDFSLVPNLVYSGEGRDVLTTIVKGEILMENRVIKNIDVEKVLFEAEKAAKKIVQDLPFQLNSVWPVS